MYTLQTFGWNKNHLEVANAHLVALLMEEEQNVL